MSEEIVVQAGDQDVTLNLFKTAGLDFRLVDRATGAPISDPRISLGPGSANHIIVSGTDSSRYVTVSTLLTRHSYSRRSRIF